MNPVLIVGCGDIGMRLAKRLAPRRVVGLVRSAASAERLRCRGVTPVQVDLDTDTGICAVAASRCEVFYLAPPPGAGEQDSRVARVCRHWRGDSLPRRLVYISTSAVYGDCAGAWIDESAPLEPGSARGRRRLDAESRWRRWSDETGVPVVVLRVPGIYACDRLPVKRLRAGLPVLSPQESPYSNRIHADDLVQVCLAAMARGQAGAAYNAADGAPVRMTEYFFRVADCLGLARPPVVDRQTAERRLSASMLSFLAESKRLDNRRLLHQLGVRLQYPDLASGLAACRSEAVAPRG